MACLGTIAQRTFLDGSIPAPSQEQHNDRGGDAKHDTELSLSLIFDDRFFRSLILVSAGHMVCVAVTYFTLVL